MKLKPLRDTTESDGENPIELYDLTLSQIEPPLLEVVMKKCRGNQSASGTLGLNRGTLRKTSQIRFVVVIKIKTALISVYDKSGILELLKNSLTTI